MKKLTWLGLAVCALGATAIMTSCGKTKLQTPKDVTFNEDNVISWTLVDNAKTYIVSVTNVDTGAVTEYSTRKSTYSLSKLEEGDYEIKLKAVGDKNKSTDSKWTSVMQFHKYYETGCLYTLIKNDTEYEITKVGSASKTVKIEDEYRGKPVTRIANGAFKSSGRVEEIQVGANVDYIGDNAFYNCSKLTAVSIPDSVTYLGRAAFQSCRALTSVNIPTSVSYISDYTFAYCRSLEEIEIHNKIVAIGESAFSDCSALKEIVIPDSVVNIGQYAFSSNTSATSITLGKGLESLGEFTFGRCSSLTSVNFSEESHVSYMGNKVFTACTALEEIAIPEGVTDMGEYAFYGDTELTEVSLPSTLEHIGKYSFHDTKLYQDTVDNGKDYVYADKWLVATSDNAKTTLEKITATTLKSGVEGIADNVFEEFTKLSQIELPDTLRVIGQYAFSSCPALWKVEPSSMSGLKTIGGYAFYKCQNLTRIIFGEGLERIGEYAFCGCAKLDNNSMDKYSLIPDTVKSIGTYAFRDTKLWNTPDEYGIVYAGNWVVGFRTLRNANVQLTFDSDRTAGVCDYAFYNCTSLRSIQGLANVKYVGRAAFCGCSSLATVTLNSNLRKIEDYTFYNCSSLYRITLPRRLDTIGRSAFYNCSSLDSIDFNESDTLSSIGDYAFYGCTNLSTVNFDDADKDSVLETIGNYAFYGCSAITKLSLPVELTTIGEKAFFKCTMLVEVNFGGSEQTIGENAFAYCSALKKIQLPDSMVSVGSMAFYKCAEVTSLELGKGVKNIGTYAFYGFEKVKYLEIPSNVEYIGEYAFKGMTSMKSIVIKSDIARIDSHSFYGCKNMTIYTDAQGLMPEWSKRFNSSFRPVVWGCTLSEDGTYFVSVTITNKTFSNVNELVEFTNPEREGYEFVGWTSDPNGEVSMYEKDSVPTLPVGTTVYAIWAEK